MLPCTHSRRSSGFTSVGVVAVIFFLLWRQPVPYNVKESISNFSPSSLAPSRLLESIAPSSKQSGGADNATLGFEVIFAVSPWSTWRSEGLLLAANRTNLTVTIPPQTPPSQPEVDTFMANSISGTLNEGSARAWLGHLQVLNMARNSNYSSVLILEDDADWDVDIHNQASMVASAVRSLSTPSNSTAAPGWPWGNYWDVLWLGHCGERLPFPEEIEEPEPTNPTGVGEDDEGGDGLYSGRILSAWEIPKRRKVAGVQRPHDPFTDDYILLNDTTIPANISSYDARLSNGAPFMRWVQYAAGPVCSFAYAVNARSIARILDEFTHGAAQAWDLWLHTHCRSHELRCFSINPELFHHHVPAAAQNLQHSLVNVHLQGQGTRNYTANIRYSARCNWDKGDDELVTCIDP